MTEVELPDGTVVEFPDGMSQDQIKGVLQKKFGAPKADDGRGGNTGMMQPDPPGLGDKLLRQVGLAGRHTAEALSAIPLQIGDAANSTLNLGIKGVNSVAGSDIPYLPKPSQTGQQLIDATGLPKPENAMERIVSYPSKALAGMGPTVAAGKLAQQAPGAISGLAELAKGLAPQAGGAVGGGLAQGVTA
jgi:hypothetical protein